jgi:polysaccharide export outer membrane protein
VIRRSFVSKFGLVFLILAGTGMFASAAQAGKPSAKQPDSGDGAVVAGDRGVPDDYVIGTGDILQIAVWKEPDVSVPTVVVRPDGRIAIPLIKDVNVAGLTPAQAEKEITGMLSKYINTPNVTVVVATIHSKKVYILGGVKKEGPIPYTYRMSVMQALSEAGGLTEYAKRKKIYVLRTENGKDYRLPFNYDAVIKGENMEQNIQLLAGDTVVVPH